MDGQGQEEEAVCCAAESSRHYSNEQEFGTEPFVDIRDYGGGAVLRFLKVLGFLILWAVCAVVVYGAGASFGMESPYLISAAIGGGLIGAALICGVSTGCIDVTNWW